MKRIFLVTLMAILLPATAFAGELSYKDRIGFESSFQKGCLKDFEKESYGFEKWQQEEFCKCSALFTGEVMTYQEIKYFIKNKRYPKSLIDKRDAASGRCIEELMKAWGYPQP